MTIKVNLLPTERKKMTFDPVFWLLLVIVLLCTVGFVVIGVNLGKQIEETNKQITAAEQRIKNDEETLRQVVPLRQEIARLKEEIKMIENLKYDPVRYGNLLGEVGRVLPSNVYLSSLSIEPSTSSVIISGTAKNTGSAAPLASISGLINRISNSKIFSDASLASTSQTGNETDGFGFSFSIEARYDADAAAGLLEQNKTSDAKPSEDAVN